MSVRAAVVIETEKGGEPRTGMIVAVVSWERKKDSAVHKRVVLGDMVAKPNLSIEGWGKTEGVKD